METNDNNKDRLDRWLNGALQQYSSAEPRAGLERRILASLELTAQDKSNSRSWRWVFATAALMVCMAVAVWFGIDPHHATEKTAATTNPANAGASTKGSQSAPPQVAAVPHHVKRHSMRPRVDAVKEPRLEQFPSARPLSEEEQMLARYVREFPQEAVLVAQDQAKAHKELEELIEAESLKNDSYQ
jgi:heme/copper-type cytochrome/quinol oxidase subunit 1